MMPEPGSFDLISSFQAFAKLAKHYHAKRVIGNRFHSPVEVVCLKSASIEHSEVMEINVFLLFNNSRSLKTIFILPSYCDLQQKLYSRCHWLKFPFSRLLVTGSG